VPAYFTEGFSVRESMWHGMGEILADYPDRPTAMQKAGHDFKVVEFKPYADLGDYFAPMPDEKALAKQYPDGRLVPLTTVNDDFPYIQSEDAWDIGDAIVGEGGVYETGIVLQNGKVLSLLIRWPEPIEIPGDNSPIQPFMNLSWGFIPGTPLKARTTSVRVVCWNTWTAAEAEGERTGHNYTFRHRGDMKQHVEDAKMALQHGITAPDSEIAEYQKYATELAETKINERQRELFLTSFIPKDAVISDRSERNVDAARAAVRQILDGDSVPGDHRFTAYGLHLAGGEFLDHKRRYMSRDTYYGRTMMYHEPLKARLSRVIREVVAS
jgi:phage/plasmid-like protein (TIGR03299 family)